MSVVSKQEIMFSLIEQWNKSGVGVQTFCKSRGLSYCVFHYWRKKYMQDGVVGPETGEGAGDAFIPVALPEQGADSVVASLTLPDGRRLNLYQQVDANYLRTLLS